MLIHNYHPDTAQYLGSSLADESPLEPGVYLIPAYATEIEPPEHRQGFYRRFVDGAWGYSPVEDPAAEPTPEPEPYVPPSISDRQFFQVLAKRGLITKEEARAAVRTGTLPQIFEVFVELMPEEEQFDTLMLLEGATEFRRDHPIVDSFAIGFGMTPKDIDQLWIEASLL